VICTALNFDERVLKKKGILLGTGSVVWGGRRNDAKGLQGGGKLWKHYRGLSFMGLYRSSD